MRTILRAGNHLGEIKTYVLLQMLSLMLGEQIYVFCSDDRNARSGIVSIGGVRCISVLSAFIRLKKECGFGQEEAKVLRMCKVPCEQVMREIYEEKLEETRMGGLRYKS